MADRKRVGIVELARSLGLSTYTVSRALNGHSDVADDTRKRVLAAAAEVGYMPNALGRTLRRGRTDAVGFLLTPSPAGLVDSYFLPLLTGIDAVLAPAGYAVLVAGAAPDCQEIEVLRRLVEGRRVDAVILTRVRVEDPRAAYLRRLDFPFVMLGRDGERPETPFVDADHRASGRAATAWLAARGHRRIGLINTPAQVNASRQRLIGWQEALAEAGLAADPAWHRCGDYTAETGRRQAQALLALSPRPTAILCGNDEMAFGAAEAVRAAGLLVGVDVSIIGCDDIPIAALANPPLTTFRTSQRPFGERLAKQVLALLRGETPPSQLGVPELIERGSAGPAPAESG
ncbi:LacI family DNA-binding transcriptional regulator [Inquilinus sp. OTU3971]|uniref:LacI family DNA-binding transcriptional regulator n=1 Tax=Inquilinus sp. OTU3971 TaxID=3043855 RepID=UPI00313D6995